MTIGGDLNMTSDTMAVIPQPKPAIPCTNPAMRNAKEIQSSGCPSPIMLSADCEMKATPVAVRREEGGYPWPSLKTLHSLNGASAPDRTPLSVRDPTRFTHGWLAGAYASPASRACTDHSSQSKQLAAHCFLRAARALPGKLG